MHSLVYRYSNKIKLFACLCVLACASGCSTVKPWQKGTLAKNEMAFIPDPLESKLSDHIYFAKEATGAGAEISGGGCGCN